MVARATYDKKRPEYTIWRALNQRCRNPKTKWFHNYGGRGIRVAAEWTGRGGFARFIEHVGPRPSPKHTIDRRDNDGHYEPGNVRWATRQTQAENSRRVVMVTIGGRTQHLAAWAREIGVTPPTLAYRLRQNMSEDQLLKPGRRMR